MEMHSVKHTVVIQPGSKSGREPTGRVIGNKAFPTKQAVWKGEEWAYFLKMLFSDKMELLSKDVSGETHGIQPLILWGGIQSPSASASHWSSNGEGASRMLSSYFTTGNICFMVTEEYNGLTGCVACVAGGWASTMDERDNLNYS